MEVYTDQLYVILKPISLKKIKYTKPEIQRLNHSNHYDFASKLFFPLQFYNPADTENLRIIHEINSRCDTC